MMLGQRRVLSLFLVVAALLLCSDSLSEINKSFPVKFSSKIEPEEIKEITVSLAADEELQQSFAYRERIEGLLREISREFQTFSGISFRWQGWHHWKSPDTARNLEELSEQLDRIELKREADILIAFTGQPGLELEYTGFSLFRTATVVIIYTPDRLKLKKLLIHELGHVFGAVHVPFTNSIMSCGGEGQGFDPDNLRIIRLGRNRHFKPFGFPFPEEVREELEEAYLRIREKIINDREIKKIFAGQVAAASVPAVGQKRFICLADCSLMLAQLQLEKGQYQRAVDFCQEALKLSPGNLEALNLQAIALRRSGEVDRAIEIYKSILKVNPNQVRVLYNLGIAYGRINRLEQAEEIYLKVLELKPDFIEAHNNLGEIYLRQNRLAEAEKEFRRAVELHPGFALAYANLAELYIKKRDLARAREYVDRALEIDPRMTAAHNIKGNVLRQMGEQEEALKHYRRAVELNPKNEKALYNLGLINYDLKRWEEARKYFLQAVEADRYFAEPYAGLGLLCLQERSWDEALRYFRRAEELGYRSPVLRVNISFAYLAKKDWVAAEKEAREAIKEQPDLPTAYNNLGIALAQQNRLAEAREVLVRAVELAPLDRDAVLNLAAVEYSSGKEDRALELFLKVIALNPDHPGNGPVYNNLAVLYYRRGQYEKSWDFCLKALQSGVRVDPNLVEELRKKVKK